MGKILGTQIFIPIQVSEGYQQKFASMKELRQQVLVHLEKNLNPANQK